MTNDKLAEDIRDFLNRHYWRDGKGCSCEFWAGDYNTWMATHALPLLGEIISRLLDAARKEVAEELATPYPENVFTPLTDRELARCVDALTNCGVRAASDRLHAGWARHWSKTLASQPPQTSTETL